MTKTVKSIQEQPNASVRDLSQYSQEEWSEAQRRYEIIRPLLENPDRNAEDVTKVAKENGIHFTTLYKWMKAYMNTHDVRSLVRDKPGRKQGDTKLPEEIEAVIRQTVDELYLHKQRLSVADIATEVQRRCTNAGLTPPHANTVRKRIHKIPEAVRLRKRGFAEKAKNLYEPIMGSFPGAERPLDVVQIDHTEADIIVVDEQHRRPTVRPWLTLAIDVCTRMVVGLHISLEAPSANSVGQCVSMAILRKAEYLAQIGVEGIWPVWGMMRTIHTDNGKEFRGEMLRRACQTYGIDLHLRPVKTPHFGGHIERLMGTAATHIHTKPGTTFSNTQDRANYQSEQHAVLTLREFEAQFVDFIVNVYHKRFHQELNMAPVRRWELGIQGDGETPGSGMPPLVVDADRLKLDFLPFEERTIQPYGIQIDDIHYFSEGMTKWIGATDPQNSKRKRKFIIRRDPRDISYVYFLDPELNNYLRIPSRGLSLPPITLWEYRIIRKKMIEEGKSSINEHEIAEALERIRQGAQTSAIKTKAARRYTERYRQALQSKTSMPKTEESTSIIHPSVHHADMDIFSQPIEGFEDLK